MCQCSDPCAHNARCLRIDVCRRCLGGQMPGDRCPLDARECDLDDEDDDRDEADDD